jgi:hypothetical protein
MRRSYVVPMSWMVIYEYEVPGGALNLNSTELPRPLAQSVQRLTTGWTVRGSNPGGGEIFRTRPDRH